MFWIELHYKLAVIGHIIGYGVIALTALFWITFFGILRWDKWRSKRGRK